jgi:hypothetical protein
VSFHCSKSNSADEVGGFDETAGAGVGDGGAERVSNANSEFCGRLRRGRRTVDRARAGREPRFAARGVGVDTGLVEGVATAGSAARSGAGRSARVSGWTSATGSGSLPVATQ